MRARLVDLGLAAVGLAAAIQAVTVHGLRRHGGPGDGLFPFVAATGLVVFVILGVVLDRRRGRPVAETPGGWGMVVAVTVLLGLYAMALPRAGYLALTAALLLVVTRLASPRPGWVKAVLLAVGLAAGTFVLFARGLGVPLPAGPRGW